MSAWPAIETLLVAAVVGLAAERSFAHVFPATRRALLARLGAALGRAPAPPPASGGGCGSCSGCSPTGCEPAAPAQARPAPPAEQPLRFTPRPPPPR